MFKWGKRDGKSSYPPKTPKMSSVALPEGRFTPITTLKSPANHKPISNLLFRHFTPERRNTASVLERRQTPLDTSRARTLSSPSGHLPAPRPVRPHPSQGPFHLNNYGPAAVPSAQFLEAQIRTMPPEALRPGPSITQKLLDAEYDYAEEKRMKGVASKNQDMEIHQAPSKAYKDLLEEESQNPKSTKASSKRNPVDFNSWKPVPVMAEVPVLDTTTDDKRPILRSAMKKTPSTGPPLKSAMKRASEPARGTATEPVVPVVAAEPMRGYYSESESSRRKIDDRPKLRVTKIPSKAWLEVQEENREEERLRALGLPVRGVRGLPVYPVYGRNAFPQTNSATPSPVDPVQAPQDHYRDSYHRTRRASDPRPLLSSYTQPYVRPGSEEYMRQVGEDWGKGISYSILAWPLVDYAARRRESMPLIWFDAGFNPRLKRYAIKAKRGPHFTPLTREEEIMLLSQGNSTIHHITIINRKLDRWPIHIHLPYQIRVIDVFRAIHDMYAQPLTHQEMESIGAEAIARCGRAWKQRCEDGPEPTHIEERKGLLRIDLLRGRRIFKGLVPTRTQSDTYELLFDEGR